MFGYRSRRSLRFASSKYWNYLHPPLRNISKMLLSACLKHSCWKIKENALRCFQQFYLYFKYSSSPRSTKVGLRSSINLLACSPRGHTLCLSSTGFSFHENFESLILTTASSFQCDVTSRKLWKGWVVPTLSRTETVSFQVIGKPSIMQNLSACFAITKFIRRIFRIITVILPQKYLVRASVLRIIIVFPRFFRIYPFL